MTDKDLCDEKHKTIKETLELHNSRLNSHSEAIDKLSISDQEHSTEIKNLCKQISDLVVTIRWFICLLVGSFVTFFFYAVQSKLF